MSGAPHYEIKDEPRQWRRMRSRRFYEYWGLNCYVYPLIVLKRDWQNFFCMVVS